MIEVNGRKREWQLKDGVPKENRSDSQGDLTLKA
jgi:hypothetical protein